MVALVVTGVAVLRAVIPFSGGRPSGGTGTPAGGTPTEAGSGPFDCRAVLLTACSEPQVHLDQEASARTGKVPMPATGTGTAVNRAPPVGSS